MQPNYYVLRLNHRIIRDKRLSTHVGLIARAFGAKGLIYSGEKDNSLESSLTKINENRGGSFEIEYWDDYLANLKFLSKTDTVFVHLTMYGEKIQKVQHLINEMYTRLKKNILIIVGGAKVPDIIYKISHFNISVTNQPHSEAGALAVALDRIFIEAINN
jgi:tRNA (cytidine56-2'-O)-methyltransferase